MNNNEKRIRENADRLVGKIKIMPIGGLGEVGKNCYLVEYDDSIYIIDYGVIFPSKEQLKVDYIIPNYYYLKENEHKIKGLFITHGHEDHIGGIPFLLKKVKINKIYAPLTAKMMIEKKFKEAKISQPINLIDDETVLNFGKVKIYTFRQTHSIPDAMGLFFETPAGNVATTGDFKVDYSPPGQKRSDFKRMSELSQKGVLCLMSDSTNSLTSGVSLSESIVGNNLATLMKEAEGRIFFTTFASNINRVQQIIKAAKDNGRLIALAGRSLLNALDIGMKTDYIKASKKDLIDLRDVKNYPDDKVCIIMTGSQGEELAALSRIANGVNAHITLNTQDTIVFASNPIPGNNYQIGKVIDAIYKANCKVIINNSELNTHASGHASKEEQKLLLSLFEPEYFAPVHGTHNMLVEHKKTGQLLGIKEENSFIMSNGDILEFTNGKPKILINQNPSEEIHISGNKIDINKNDRDIYKLAQSGLFAIVIYYNKRTKKLVTYPQITTRGYLVINKSIDVVQELQKDVIRVYNENIKENESVKKDRLEKFILGKLNKRFNQKPLVIVELIEFDNEF